LTTFNFTVDREYKVLAPLTLHPTAELQGEAFTAQPGESLVYTGMVIIDGVPRYCLKQPGRKGYTRDREAVVRGLSENYDALMQVL
jgi:hypothetical protein